MSATETITAEPAPASEAETALVFEIRVAIREACFNMSVVRIS